MVLRNKSQRLRPFLQPTFILLSIIFSISLLARFWFFWTPSLTGDEADYTRVAITVLRGAVDLIRLRQPEVAVQNLFLPFLQHGHGPMEFVFLLPAVIFHPREFSTRLVYVLFGTIVYIFSYFKLRKYRGQTTALAFATFFGTSPYIIWWTQTAMYQSLSIAASIFTTLSLIRLVKLPEEKSFLYLGLSLAFSLLTFQDLILYLPAILWAVWDARKSITKRSLVKISLITVLIPSLFYIPWILYGVLGIAPNTGFAYFFQNKIATHPSVFNNLREFWQNFFAFPGVFTIWPLSLVTLFLLKKHVYLKYLWLTIVLMFFVYVFRSYKPYYYFVSLIGPLAILAAEVVASSRKYAYWVIGLIVAFQLFQLLPLFNGVHNPLIGQQIDGIKDAGEIAKKCVTQDNETYISTEDYGRTFYYFGRPSTVFQDGLPKKLELLQAFLDGKLPQVKLVHYKLEHVSQDMRTKLKSRTLKSWTFDQDEVLLFSECEML